MGTSQRGVTQDIVQRRARRVNAGPRLAAVCEVDTPSQGGNALLLGEPAPSGRLRSPSSYFNLMYDPTAIGIDQAYRIVTPGHGKQLPYFNPVSILRLMMAVCVDTP
jgi:hypothetical protein